jgi:hypothetical protein
MSLAVEFLSGPRVLMLRVYAPLMAARRKSAVDNIKGHGCYRAGIPLLLDGTESESPDLSWLEALRATLTSAFPESPIAVVIKPGASPPAEAPAEEGVFTSRTEALHFLTAAGQQRSGP